MPAGRTVRSASHVGDTRVLRYGFGRKSWDPAIVERADIFHRVKVRPRGSADLTVCRFAGHDQTPKQPEDAMVEAGISTDAVPRDRRRSESSWWFQPGHSRGPTKVGIVAIQYQESEGGGSALVLRKDACVRVKASAGVHS